MRIFLSHSGKDKDIVESIGVWLIQKGYSVWLDKWSMSSGDSLIQKVSEGIESSDKLVIFLSPNSVDSNWVKKEIATGLILELAEKNGLSPKFVIPALLKNCKIPILLSDKLYANFTDKPFEEACQELLKGILDKPCNPIDKKLENRVLRCHKVMPRQRGNHATIFEFAVKLSPTDGLSITVDCGTNYMNHLEWFNQPNKPEIPSFISFRCENSQSIDHPSIFMHKFESPGLNSSKSYYLYLETNEELKPKSIRFLDFYDKKP